MIYSWVCVFMAWSVFPNDFPNEFPQYFPRKKRLPPVPPWAESSTGTDVFGFIEASCHFSKAYVLGLNHG